MNYSYFITSQVQRELDRSNHNMVVTRELSRLLDSHQAMQDKERRKHSKVYLQRPMTDGGPRLVFFKECNEELHQTIYVLRKAYENHNDYQRGFNSVDVKVWIDNHSYSEEEAAELKAEFERLSHKDGKDPLPRDYREYEVKRAFEQQHESMIFELPEWRRFLLMTGVFLVKVSVVSLTIHTQQVYSRKEAISSLCIFQPLIILSLTELRQMAVMSISFRWYMARMPILRN